MRILRNVLLVIVGILLLFGVIGLFLPSNIHVERSGIVSASPTMVYQLLSAPKIFNQWSPWMKMDPNMKIDYFGPPTGEGAGYTWNSVDGDLGTGSWKIIGTEFPKQISIELQFGGMSPALSKQMVEAAGNGTKVTWTLDSDMGWDPLSRWFGLLMDGMVGADFEDGLRSLDSLAKSKQQGRLDKIEVLSEPERHAYTIRAMIAPSQLSTFFARSYMTIAQGTDEKIAGMPFAIYHMWSKDSTDVEAGMPIANAGISTASYVARTFPAGQIVRGTYFGPYEGTESAHAKIYEYTQKNGLTITGSPWEVYANDPGTEPDPSSWLTYICYPVSPSK